MALGWRVGREQEPRRTELKPGELTATYLLVDRSNLELPFINPQTQELLPMRVIHSTSTDGGARLAASTCTRAIMQLPSGLLAKPYEHWKEFDDPEPAWPAGRVVPRDDGATLPEFATAASHPANRLAYWDQRLAIHPVSDFRTATTSGEPGIAIAT